MFDRSGETFIGAAAVWLVACAAVAALAAPVAADSDAPGRGNSSGDRLTRLARRLAGDDPGARPGGEGGADQGTARPSGNGPGSEGSGGRSDSLPPQVETSSEDNRRMPPPAGTFPGVSGSRAGSSTFQWVAKTVAALGAVIGLILLLRAVLARMSGRANSTRRGGVVEVLGRFSIAPRSHVLVLRLGRRILAVGETPGGLNTLADINDGEEVADLLRSITQTGSDSSTHRFSKLMGRFNTEYGDEQRIEEEGNDHSEFHIDRARDGVLKLLSRIRTTAGKGDGA